MPSSLHHPAPHGADPHDAGSRRPDPQRRRLLRALGGAALAAPWAGLSFAAAPGAGANRFVFVILRGGLDGLAAVPAVGDPDFAAARAALADFGTAPLPLAGDGALFALHPALAQMHAMYGRGELAVVHAAVLPYRERSHFDAQQVLESGGVRPYEFATGWLGRALARDGVRAMALATAVPLTLRGPGGAAVDTWAPSALPDPSADLVGRIERMYAGDRVLAAALERAKALHFDPAMAAEMGAGSGARQRGFAALAAHAAEFLAQPGGPQVAVLEISGWDTHANQMNPNGALAFNLRQLDAGLAALRDGLVAADAWRRTAVVVATEFGREVAINGTLGTDHGSGGAAFVLGGAVNGGRVLADWPGLAKKNRYEGRDLRGTTDLRAVFKGVLGPQLRIAERTLGTEVFPGSEAVRPLGLLRG